ncbi:MAG: zinc-binding dehydrogenase [Alphaproteobacteria bacterium]
MVPGGAPENCACVKDTLSADAAVDYKAEPNLRAACPNGVDVFFDNVGGTIFDTVLSLINMKARLIVCGNIAAAARGVGASLSRASRRRAACAGRRKRRPCTPH